MRWTSITGLAGALGLAALLSVPAPAQTDAPDREQGPEGVEVMARGPVHEAFAEPSAPQPEASPVVPKEPPEAIDELPPDQKPEGDNVQWIPGYWAWDDESNNFLWISGFWRDVPPDRRWVPGAWQKVEGGWQWVAGFWASAESEEVEYVPPPPESLERGPTTPAPEEESDYVPGCWIWRQTRFFWRPGYWLAHRPGWVWVPARYVWSPAGCVFVNGYWDYPLHDRGLLFAPVRIDRTVLVKRWAYTPSYVVQPDFLLTSLFVRPATRHYYFGDYFERGYVKRGFVPWVDYRFARTVPDPNFAYYRHEFRGDRWEKGLRDLYVGRFEGEIARPPRTLVQQSKVIQNLNVKKTENITVNKNINITNFQNVNVLAPIRKVANTPVTALASLAGPRTDVRKIEAKKVVKLETVAREERTRVEKSVSQVREVAKQRQELHSRLLKEGPSTRPAQPDRPVERRPARLELPKPTAPPPPATRPEHPRPERKLPPSPRQEDPKSKPPPPPRHEDPKPK
ncbi:MAG TPA: hypothetical protein VKD72_19265, partial [Gemmataceae bacterium]|nr:hypothetical protein [Gemmataceae bacterium]